MQDMKIKNLTLGILMILLIGSILGINGQNYIVEPYKPVVLGQKLIIDTLSFRYPVILLQDNSEITVNYIKMGSRAIIRYGDVGDSIPNSELIPIQRYLGDESWFDYMNPDDKMPSVTFTKCRPKQLIIEENILVIYNNYCEDTSLSVNSFSLNNPDFKELNVEIYDFRGIKIYRGRYVDLFYRDKIKPEFTNKFIIIRLSNGLIRKMYIKKN